MPVSKLILYTATALLLAVAPLNAADTDTSPTEGLHESEATLHALTGATIVIRPGTQLEKATLVLRDGVIVAVGQGVDVPPGAVVHEMTGRTLYPALIDPYGEAELPAADPKVGTAHWNKHVRPQDRVADSYRVDTSLNKTLRQQGIAVRLVAPDSGIVKGVSALVTTDDSHKPDHVIADEVAQHVRLTISHSGSRDQFPNSPMGAVALARQTFSDAHWYRNARQVYAQQEGLERPEVNAALAALEAQLAAKQLIMFDAPNELFALRAADFADEFQLKQVVLRGSGKEYRRLAEVRSTGHAVIVPVNFPKPPNVASAAAARDVRLEHLMHWDHAPENPARLVEAGVTIALTSHGMNKRGDFLKQVRMAVKRGLSPDAALAALTIAPAKLLGVSDRLGTLEAGKAANVLVADGELFAEKTRVMELWIDGKQYRHEEDRNQPLAGTWSIEAEGDVAAVESLPSAFELTVKPDGKVEGKAIGSDDDQKEIEAELKNVSVNQLRLEFTFDARRFGGEGVARYSMPLPELAKGKVHSTGHLVWPDGAEITVKASHKKTKKEAADENEKEEAADDDKKETKPETKMASFPVSYPLGAYGVEQLPEQPEVLLFTGATVWTAGKAGILEGASVLVENGVITAVGKTIDAPDDATVIDLAGKHLSPGIIDCHSHMATDGGVNESSQAVTAEVRIGDFIDPDDISIYRQLAGGVTAANILHGSANPIGGQNQVIKLRWGAAPNGMKFKEAPPGIKFALGENVKQSNWGEEYTTRYPQTRMGVDQIIRDSLNRAIAYQQRHEAWQQKHEGLPPRRDLELEALAEVAENTRWIHCHSYRQDEILALIRTLDDFEITIGTFQHILEGYKVADAMAKHGAMGSSFSDWWAYKFEVYDAIPYNGVLMHKAGVVVSFNSDDDELGRHLNLEAAKAVKYGGISAEEAIKFVTLNPAKQLRIEQHVGSLEVGKQADLVVWNTSPLSSYSRCEQTWVDGRKYFDLEEDQARRKQAVERRRVLVQKILASGLEMLEPGEEMNDDSELWPRHDAFCHGHDHGHEH